MAYLVAELVAYLVAELVAYLVAELVAPYLLLPVPPIPSKEFPISLKLSKNVREPGTDHYGIDH